jgi:hypothetical protein
MTPHRPPAPALAIGLRPRALLGRTFARFVPTLNRGTRWRFTLVTVAILLLFATTTRACSVPVYRYALDRWPADPYELDVSATDAKDPGVARFLRNFTDNTPINLAPVRLQEAGSSHLAFPHAAPEAAPAWAGALDAAAIPSLIDSPARTELTHRILAGETGVWLLVESGERSADDQAATMLDKRLHYLEQAADIPPIDPDDPTNELGPGPPLMVKFSVLRVRHDDPAEQAFLRMLAGPKHDTQPSTGPWLALVFGRGRVLGAWPAEGFGNEQIDEASLFLLGACSCQVKRMNPGWDLLLNANWDEALQAMGFQKPGQPATVTAPDGPNAPSPTVAKATVNEGTAAPIEQIVEKGSSAVPAAVKAEPVTVTYALPPAVTTSRGAGLPAAAGALALLVIGSIIAWRAFQRHP